MKIAIFTDTYLPDLNGVSSSINQYTRLLADDGHKILIFCPKCGLYKDKRYPNITVKRYPSITAPSYKDFRLALPIIWRTVYDLKLFKPDVVHAQTPLGIGWTGIWATKLLKLKNIQTYHTYIPEFLVYVNPKTIFGINKIQDYIKSSKLASLLSKKDILESGYKDSSLKASFNKIAQEINKKPSKKTNKMNDRFGRSYTRLVYNRADLVLTPSMAMKKVLKKQGVEPKIEVMSNGINYDLFTKKTDFTINYQLVHIGRLGFEKSVDVIIKAFALAHQTNPRLKLDIYGDGPARKSLQLLAKKLRVNKSVKFFGPYDITKLAKSLHKYDCFVSASTIETQGIVILEAMASGLPVLGVTKLAVPEVVKDNQNGYLSRPFNEKDMAKNMLRIVESSKIIKRFSQKSLDIAKSHEIHTCKDKLVKIYQQVIKSKAD